MRAREPVFRADLTTNGSGVDDENRGLVYQPPVIRAPVPGLEWTGRIEGASAVIRIPAPDHFNGKLMVGGIPAVRNERALDQILSDIVLQRGYAYAACDKGTPGLTLRDPRRSMAEWVPAYRALVRRTGELLRRTRGRAPVRTYIAGVSNGGYVVRALLEQEPDLFDGGVEWEGLLMDPAGRHLMTTLPVLVEAYPHYRAAKDSTARRRAHDRLVEAGLATGSESSWDRYFSRYWVVSLWLYGRNLDPDWEPFSADFTPGWLDDPAPLLGDYRPSERQEQLRARMAPLANTGDIGRPLISIAGDYDCLLPFRDHAEAYELMVRRSRKADRHRLYRIPRGNHVDGLLRAEDTGQRPVLPFFEAALYRLEAWVEQGEAPPPSRALEQVSDLYDPDALLTPAGGP